MGDVLKQIVGNACPVAAGILAIFRPMDGKYLALYAEYANPPARRLTP
jgi:hypothetical protein